MAFVLFTFGYIGVLYLSPHFNNRDLFTQWNRRTGRHRPRRMDRDAFSGWVPKTAEGSFANIRWVPAEDEPEVKVEPKDDSSTIFQGSNQPG